MAVPFPRYHSKPRAVRKDNVLLAPRKENDPTEWPSLQPPARPRAFARHSNLRPDWPPEGIQSSPNRAAACRFSVAAPGIDESNTSANGHSPEPAKAFHLPNRNSPPSTDI